MGYHVHIWTAISTQQLLKLKTLIKPIVLLKVLLIWLNKTARVHMNAPLYFGFDLTWKCIFIERGVDHVLCLHPLNCPLLFCWIKARPKHPFCLFFFILFCLFAIWLHATCHRRPETPKSKSSVCICKHLQMFLHLRHQSSSCITARITGSNMKFIK